MKDIRDQILLYVPVQREDPEDPYTQLPAQPYEIHRWMVDDNNGEYGGIPELYAIETALWQLSMDGIIETERDEAGRRWYWRKHGFLVRPVLRSRMFLVLFLVSLGALLFAWWLFGSPQWFFWFNVLGVIAGIAGWLRYTR